jgi:ankyrin repeat protein
MSAQADSDGKLTAPPLQDTKQTVMMEGYLTELYTRADFDGVSMRLWVAEEFPNYKQINSQLARLRFGFGVPVKNIDLTKVPGMVMKSEAEIGGTHPHLVITTLLSAKEAPVDAAAFVIPEDYHAVNWQNEATSGADLARTKALLKENPGMVFNKDTNGVLPLQTAAANGEMNVLELLLDNKADVNAKDNTGGTALGEALIYGHKDVVELLLAHNADVNARDNDGTTPLHLAAMVRNQDMLELLLAHKADVNATNNVGVTSLHEAVSWNYKEVVELLLSHKADVNAKDEYGATPLHYAASKGYKDIVELLLASKADIHVRNNMGQTPLQCAVKSGHEGVAKLLRQYGVE